MGKILLFMILLAARIFGQSEIILFDDNFKPSDAKSATLWAWYEYDDLTTLSLTTNLVNSWLDKSGGGHTLTPGVESLIPSWSSTGIVFDGVDDRLLASADASLVQPTTIYIVMKNLTWTNGRYLWDGNIFLSMALANNTITPRVIIRTSAFFAFDNLILDTWFIVKVVYNSTSSSIRLNNGTPTTGNAGTTNAGGFKLGCDGTGGSTANIAVKYIAIYKGVTSTQDDANIIKYFNNKANVY